MPGRWWRARRAPPRDPDLLRERRAASRRGLPVVVDGVTAAAGVPADEVGAVEVGAATAAATVGAAASAGEAAADDVVGRDAVDESGVGTLLEEVEASLELPVTSLDGFAFCAD
jgi:hypothetical protein